MITISKKGQSILDSYNAYKKTGVVNTTSLSEAAIRAAQALSEKFGIATFDLQGKVNTIPLTRPLDTRINVGVGSTGLTSQALNNYLKSIQPPTALVPTPPTIVIRPPSTADPEKNIEPENPNDKSFIPTNLSDNIQKYLPAIIIGTIAIVGLKVIKS